MCYTAIPGQTGIRAAFFEAVSRPELVPTSKPLQTRGNKQFTKSAIPSASVASAYATAARIVSMSVEFIPYPHRRRERQTSHEKGKRLAKRQHKPDWRNYEKY